MFEAPKPIIIPFEENEREFWEQKVALLLQEVCLIEREKLKREYTTAQLRKLGKDSLCVDTTKDL